MDCNFFFGMFHQGGETGPKGSNVAGNRAKREFRGWSKLDEEKERSALASARTSAAKLVGRRAGQTRSFPKYRMLP